MMDCKKALEEAGAVPLGADVREVGAELNAGVAEAMAGDAHRGEHGAAARGGMVADDFTASTG